MVWHNDRMRMAAPLFKRLTLGLAVWAMAGASAIAQVATDDAQVSAPVFSPETATSGAASAVANITPIKQDEPVVFTSDTVYYDQKNEIVTLTGQVELSQNSAKGVQTVKADEITFDRFWLSSM